MMNCKGIGRKQSWPIRHIIPSRACREREKPQKTSARIADDTAEIRTDDLPIQVRSIAATPAARFCMSSSTQSTLMFSEAYAAGTSLFAERVALEVHQHLSGWRT
jgi:hypothetical protein